MTGLGATRPLFLAALLVRCMASGKSRQCMLVTDPCLLCPTRSGIFQAGSKSLLLEVDVNTEACLSNMVAMCVIKIIFRTQLSMIKPAEGVTNLINKNNVCLRALWKSVVVIQMWS